MADVRDKRLLNLKPFPKGKSGNPKGRPRKLVTQLNDIGYKKQEVVDTMLNLLALSVDELKEVHDNANATVLEKTVAAAIYNGIKKGSLYNVMEILARAIGRPKEEVDVKSDATLTGGVTVTVVNVDTPFASSESEVDTN